MLVVIGCVDRYLSANLGRIVHEQGLRAVRTFEIDRVTRELKTPDRLAIIDMKWEAVQPRGVLKQIVNVGMICGNKVVCICPNRDEELKKLARSAFPAEIFLRYDLETAFKDYIGKARGK